MSANVIYPRGFQFGGSVLTVCIWRNYSCFKSLWAFHELLLAAVEEVAGVGCNSKVQNLNDNLLRFVLYCEQIRSLIMLYLLTITPVMMKPLIMP